MNECIKAVEEAFRELAQGTATMPTRVSIPIQDKSGWLGVMPAYLAGAGILSSKVVAVYPNNEKTHSMPSVLATIILNDSETGSVQAVLEGSYITAMRTGAVSGVATKYLAREDSQVVGIFGAGVQAQKQLEAVSEVSRIRAALVYDTDISRSRRFADLNSAANFEISIAATPRELVEVSDIVITATTSPTPVFNGNDLKPGTHINAIGAFTPTSRELDDQTISTSKIVVDSIDAALAEAGDLAIPLERGVIHRRDVWAELGEIVTRKKTGRTSTRETTIFKSVGLGIQDAAVAKAVFENAQSAGVGTHFDLES